MNASSLRASFGERKGSISESDRTTNPRAVVAGIKTVDRADTAAAGTDRFPTGPDIVSHRGNHPHTGDHHPSLTHVCHPTVNPVTKCTDLQPIKKPSFLNRKGRLSMAIMPVRRRSGVRDDVVDRVLNGAQLFGLFVRNLGFEFLFQSHNQLGNVQ